jgi:acetyl-CoA carboxylase biotin carboxylase subunit
MDKLLIANRGEIAVRICRAARELGLRTVAVYSEADREALHVRMADEAYELGPPEPLQSYLDQSRLIDIARVSGADAVHPGYGFLSENAGFAAACGDAGLTFVGPSPDAIRRMGSKIESKAIAQQAEVPVIPGFSADDAETFRQHAAGAADRIGYPILVKASAGGGGKGMRIVEIPDDLQAALAAGAREAQQAFGDATLMLEKYITQPRHVEIQVLGDQHGHLVHLYERECSVQRRHQKIIEETPSPAVTTDIREQMAAAALRLAGAVNYTGAGTVEFILGPDGQFYFLEMNTRLQVEHPVTEMVTGIDLVHQQLRIARGEPMAFGQGDIMQRGHAIECRLYAEDPARGFLPATGKIAVLREPSGPGRRIDSGIMVHAEVTPYYDPILCKLVSYGHDRHEAIVRMQSLLREYTLLGVTTNRQFLLDILESKPFANGDTDTSFIDRYFPDWQPDASIPTEIRALAAVGEMLYRSGHLASSMAASAAVSAAPPSPWQRMDGWRIGGG